MDTNAYRVLSLERDPDASLSELRRLEWCHGVQAYAHPYVLWELLTHLHDRTDRAFEACRTAVRLALAHARYAYESGEPVAYLEDPETGLCRAFFNEVPATGATFVAHVDGLCRLVAQTCAGDDLTSIAPQLGILKTQNGAVEAEFVRRLWDYVVKTQIPVAAPGDWDPFRANPTLRRQAMAFLQTERANEVFAKAYVLRSLEVLKKDLDPTEVENRAKWMAHTYRVTLSLYNEIVKRIVGTGCNLDRPHRRNWVWDLEIALCAGVPTKGRRCRLISSDGDMLKAAKAVGAEDVVLSFEQYRSLLRECRFPGV